MRMPLQLAIGLWVVLALCGQLHLVLISVLGNLIIWALIFLKVSIFGPSKIKPEVTTRVKSLKSEIQAFEKRKNVLLKKHFGKYVIFKSGKLVGSFETFNVANDVARKAFGKDVYLIKQVLPEKSKN